MLATIACRHQEIYQVSQNANGTVNYNFAKKTFRHNMMASFNYQVSSQQIGSVRGANTKIYNGNVSYSIQHRPSKLSIALTGNKNKTEAMNLNTLLYGPGLSVSKSFLKNTLNLGLGSIYNASVNNNVSTGIIFSERLNLSFNPKINNPKYGKPSISLSCSYINKPKVATTTYALSEFTGNLNVGYSF
jgi:hypothetical protein